MMRISVVIPTWNEAATIVGTLQRLRDQGADEVILEGPLLGDVGLAMRLRRHGRVAVESAQIFVSPRRWARHGILGQTLRN